MSKKRTFWAGSAAVLLALGATIVFWNPWWAGAEPSAGLGPAPLTQAELANLNNANSLSAAFRTAASRVLPAVVTIHTTVEVKQVNDNGGIDKNQIPEQFRDDPLFRRFFEGMPQMPRQRPREGMGSGFIIDSSGLILTNNHVVKDGDKVVVKLHDGREYEAVDVKSDPRSDLAIVKIEPDKPVPFVKFGDSDKMEIGDWVIAVGAPFRLQESVTAGIVSGKSRVVGINDREEYLQTDAAINPGNSGGPLINLAGEVIGINTAISTTSGGYQGIGFAIPANQAHWVVDQLKENGAVKRAYLGVLIRDVSAQLADQLGLDHVSGVLVTHLKKGGPADKAGLKVGDVILKFAGKPVSQPSELQGLVERSHLGSKQQMNIIRDGKAMTLNVEVAEMPKELAQSDFIGGPGESVQFADLGIAVENLDKETAGKLGLGDGGGVLITEVKSGGVADKAGLTVGMAIVKIGRTAVTDVASLEKELKKYSLDEGLVMTVRTTEGSKIVFLGR